MKKIKRRLYKYLLIFKPIIYFVSAIILIIFLIWFAPKTFPFFKTILKVPSAIISLINPSITKLDSSQNRTNILLLGIGGGDHPGGDLTDSIMLISVDIKTGDAVLISLPRDIWVESLSAKLNHAYRFGEEKQAGSGLVLAKSAVSEITNQPVHYTVLLDFSGFEKAIDIIGGLDINVPHGFVDEQYPVPGKESAQPESDRYQTLEFLAGQQHMDGSTALKYVRSRHAKGIEGTDFARAQRQQRVILALKDQLLTARVILNPKKISQLKQAFQDSVKTDIDSSAYPDLLKLAMRIDQDNIRTGIIDQGSETEEIPPLLYNPPASQYGQWVLLPIDNDWQAVFDHVQEIIYQTPSN
ncbi:LCP family protein [Patescibacteria group bacterium]